LFDKNRHIYHGVGKIQNQCFSFYEIVAPTTKVEALYSFFKGCLVDCSLAVSIQDHHVVRGFPSILVSYMRDNMVLLSSPLEGVLVKIINFNDWSPSILLKVSRLAWLSCSGCEIGQFVWFLCGGGRCYKFKKSANWTRLCVLVEGFTPIEEVIFIEVDFEVRIIKERGGDTSFVSPMVVATMNARYLPPFVIPYSIKFD